MIFAVNRQSETFPSIEIIKTYVFYLLSLIDKKKRKEAKEEGDYIYFRHVMKHQSLNHSHTEDIRLSFKKSENEVKRELRER